MRALVLIAVSLSSAMPCSAQTSTCNHQTRSAQVIAGYHNAASATCAQLTIGVGGTSFSTPASCQQGYAFYDGTVYACEGGGAFTHCNPEGYKVNILTCSGGGCPTIVGLTPGTWPTWEDVPAAIAAAMSCIAPACNRTFDWSAKVTACVQEPPDPPDSYGQPLQGGSGELYSILPKESLAEAPWSVISPLISAYEEAQSGSAELLPTTLQEVYGSYAPVAGVGFKANVTVEHFDGAGQCTNRRAFALVGTVLDDGRFDVLESEPVLMGDDQEVLTTRLSFDGATLFVTGTAAEFGNAFASTYPRFGLTFKMLCFPLQPVLDWVRDPLRMPLFTSHLYRTVDYTDRQGFQRVVAWGGEDSVSEEHQVVDMGGSPRPVRWACFDQSGRVRGELTFEDHRPMSPGVWRPWHVVDTVYLDGGVTEQRIVTTLRMNRAAVVSALEGEGLPDTEGEQAYQVWQ